METWKLGGCVHSMCNVANDCTVISQLSVCNDCQWPVFCVWNSYRYGFAGPSFASQLRCTAAAGQRSCSAGVLQLRYA
jgi:hypothetical protein